MAVTKVWAIKDSLQRVLDYAANPEKTEYDALAQTLHYAENDAKTSLNESAQLVTGIHCRADHAWEDMRAVQERFGKTDGVVALHAYQSFREGEVTPEQCHEIGVALARRVWGRRFQVLVATHMNTDNLHNHFVINSVSYVDGKKYEQRRSQYAEFRAASDKLCREYGLSVVEQPKNKEPARYARMREAIDQACEDASTAEDFHRALYRQGYIFGSDPNRRYATIRARDGGRAVRLYGWEKNTILQPSMTDCAEITCCMGQGCMNGNTRPGKTRRNGIAPRIPMREKVFSRFSSRYSSENPRCTAYICTTVISWVSCPRNNSRASIARN